eukprot:gene8129-12589_t
MLAKIVALVLIVFVLSETKIPQNFRLLKVDNEEILIHKDRVSEYEAKEGKLVNFVDTTFTQDLEKPNPEVVEFAKKSTFPDEPTQKKVVKKMIKKIDSGHSFDHVTKVVKHLQSYKTRHARSTTGVEAVEWIKAEYEKRIAAIEDKDRRKLFSVRVVKHTNWLQPSLVITMKGKTDEIVILGGHIDSTASGGVAPGADDDASGSSSVLEAFTIIAKYSKYVPKKTIEFHVYAAEEMGLLGSREIAREYKARSAKVYAMMQLDMTGYNPNINKIGLITNGVDANLNIFIRKLIDTYLKIGYVNRTLFGGSSDHASWRAAGYAACFPFEARTNPNIHTSRDTIDKLDFKNGIEWVKLGVSFLVELSQ